uniref:IRF tryptophan pentad repeat domain-containing protein n=1 Tax=Acanthochromis polyacanthus TaxID=80966 RepID=A0A3Q1GN29_9TELE
IQQGVSIKMSNVRGQRLMQWLVDQIESGRYPGLQWEDDNHTMFRIPWKHHSCVVLYTDCCAACLGLHVKLNLRELFSLR